MSPVAVTISVGSAFAQGKRGKVPARIENTSENK